jgi:hypothetical protein
MGRSWTFRQIIVSLPLAIPVVLSTAKLGEYFRGCSRLFFTMYDSRLNTSLRTLEFITVHHPPPYAPKLHKDWYAVIEALYARLVGDPLTVPRSQLFQSLKSTVRGYSSWDESSGFVRHVEVHLIQYLIKERMKPEVMGISKYCCMDCMEWAKKVNESDSRFGKWEGVTGVIIAVERTPEPLAFVLRRISQLEISFTKN